MTEVVPGGDQKRRIQQDNYQPLQDTQRAGLQTPVILQVIGKGQHQDASSKP